MNLLRKEQHKCTAFRTNIYMEFPDGPESHVLTDCPSWMSGITTAADEDNSSSRGTPQRPAAAYLASRSRAGSPIQEEEYSPVRQVHDLPPTLPSSSSNAQLHESVDVQLVPHGHGCPQQPASTELLEGNQSQLSDAKLNPAAGAAKHPKACKPLPEVQQSDSACSSCKGRDQNPNAAHCNTKPQAKPSYRSSSRKDQGTAAADGWAMCGPPVDAISANFFGLSLDIEPDVVAATTQQMAFQVYPAMAITGQSPPPPALMHSTVQEPEEEVDSLLAALHMHHYTAEDNASASPPGFSFGSPSTPAHMRGSLAPSVDQSLDQSIINSLLHQAVAGLTASFSTDTAPTSRSQTSMPQQDNSAFAALSQAPLGQHAASPGTLARRPAIPKLALPAVAGRVNGSEGGAPTLPLSDSPVVSHRARGTARPTPHPTCDLLASDEPKADAAAAPAPLVWTPPPAAGVDQGAKVDVWAHQRKPVTRAVGTDDDIASGDQPETPRSVAKRACKTLTRLVSKMVPGYTAPSVSTSFCTAAGGLAVQPSSAPQQQDTTTARCRAGHNAAEVAAHEQQLIEDALEEWMHGGGAVDESQEVATGQQLAAGTSVPASSITQVTLSVQEPHEQQAAPCNETKKRKADAEVRPEDEGRWAPESPAPRLALQQPWLTEASSLGPLPLEAQEEQPVSPPPLCSAQPAGSSPDVVAGTSGGDTDSSRSVGMAVQATVPGEAAPDTGPVTQAAAPEVPVAAGAPTSVKAAGPAPDIHAVPEARQSGAGPVKSKGSLFCACFAPKVVQF